MARPVQTRLDAGPTYAPEQGRSAPSLNVVAPLNVHTGPSGAEVLARSLGIALDSAKPLALDKISENAADATALGREAGRSGTVDEKRQAADQHYAAGVKRALVDRAIVDFKSRSLEFYNNEFDKTKGTETLAAELDGIAKGMLQNYSGDAEAARWMTPEVMATVNSITGAHDQELAAQFKEDRIASASELFRADVAAGSVDPQKYMDKLRPVLGGKAANEAYVQIVTTLGVEQGDPELIDTLLPENWKDPITGETVPGPKNSPALLQEINQAKYYAAAARDKRDADLKEVATAEYDRYMLKASLTAYTTGVVPFDVMQEMADKGIAVKDQDFRTLSTYAQGQRDDKRTEQFDPRAAVAFRIRMMENPKGMSTQDLMDFVAANIPHGKDGEAEAMRLADDFQSMRNAQDVVHSNPVAEADLNYFKGRYKLEPYASDAEKERYFQGIRLGQQTFIETRDPNKAFAAMESWFNARPLDNIKASGSLVNDIKAFGAGKIGAAHIREAYPTLTGDDILRKINSGEIQRSEGLKLIDALAPKQTP